MNNERVAVYPGTFDPVTNGHIDIISRAARLVEKLIVGVAVNIGKAPLFALEERVEMLEAEIAGLVNDVRTHIIVEPFSNLLMDFVVAQGGNMVVRGLRAVSDFEYEFQMAGINARLSSEFETIFLMASENQQFVASRFVKEIHSLGGDVSSFVPGTVLRHLESKKK
jgi:pantetheine-phosphate adenylyltransferase